MKSRAGVPHPALCEWGWGSTRLGGGAFSPHRSGLRRTTKVGGEGRHPKDRRAEEPTGVSAGTPSPDLKSLEACIMNEGRMR